MNKVSANLIMWFVGSCLVLFGAHKLFGAEALWLTVGCLTIVYAAIHAILYGLGVIVLRLTPRNQRTHF